MNVSIVIPVRRSRTRNPEHTQQRPGMTHVAYGLTFIANQVKTNSNIAKSCQVARAFWSNMTSDSRSFDCHRP
jgi:hypothetical protein